MFLDPALWRKATKCYMCRAWPSPAWLPDAGLFGLIPARQVAGQASISTPGFQNWMLRGAPYASFSVTDTTFTNILEQRECHWHHWLRHHRQLEWGLPSTTSVTSTASMTFTSSTLKNSSQAPAKRDLRIAHYKQSVCRQKLCLALMTEWKLEDMSWLSVTTFPTSTTSLRRLLWLHECHQWRLNYKKKVSRAQGHTKKQPVNDRVMEVRARVNNEE